MRRALLAGDFTAHLVKDGRSHALPGWAWENASAAENAFNFNWLPLNPLLDHGLGEFADWRCFVSRAELQAWLARSDIAEIGDLPTLPAPFDHDVRPDQLSYREPPERPFVELTQALTWIAFAVSLSRDEFSFMEPCGFGPFAESGWLERLRTAMAGFAERGGAGTLKVRGRYVARISDDDATKWADSNYLTDLQLRDFACFEPLYGGLQRGEGLSVDQDVFSNAFHGRDDGWREVQVRRSDLMDYFRSGSGKLDCPSRATSTAKAESDCKRWLQGEFARDPDMQRTKPEFQAAALARFSNLSARGFIRAWDAVASDAGRSKPGRKS